MGNESELHSKLRVFHERKDLAVIEEALAPVSTGRSLTADTVPAGVSDGSAPTGLLPTTSCRKPSSGPGGTCPS